MSVRKRIYDDSVVLEQDTPGQMAADALRTLPFQQRRVLLCALNKKDMREVAEELRITTEQVHRLLAKALRQIKATMSSPPKERESGGVYD
jgi:DNA-directed RNA polymerase specialized sigma24 family protein